MFDKEYWENYYAQQNAELKPSLFARFVQENVIKEHKIIIELGCGNGRDAIYLNMTYQHFLNPLPTDPDVRYHDRDMVTVNLIEAYSRLMTFVSRNLPDRFHIEGIQRIDIRDKIFREIVVNCLIHRKFANSFPAKLLIFSDRVITENWTKPIGSNTVSFNKLETHTKNPMLSKVFREIGFAEELGSGRRNIEQYAPYYYDKFKIEVENREKFIFSFEYQNPDETENETINLKDGTINETINETINPQNRTINGTINPENNLLTIVENKHTNEALIGVLKAIQFKQGTGMSDLINKLSVPKTTLWRYLNILKDKKMIEYRGSKKTGGYFLILQK